MHHNARYGAVALDFVNIDEGSESAGAIKVAEPKCAIQIKSSHGLKKLESTEVSWRQMSGIFTIIYGRLLIWAMRYIACYALVVISGIRSFV